MTVVRAAITTKTKSWSPNRELDRPTLAPRTPAAGPIARARVKTNRPNLVRGECCSRNRNVDIDESSLGSTHARMKAATSGATHTQLSGRTKSHNRMAIRRKKRVKTKRAVTCDALALPRRPQLAATTPVADKRKAIAIMAGLGGGGISTTRAERHRYRRRDPPTAFQRGQSWKGSLPDPFFPDTIRVTMYAVLSNHPPASSDSSPVGNRVASK